MAGEQPDWARCSNDGCIGVQLTGVGLCLAHAAEQAPEAFDAELKRIGADGAVDVRGVVISTELLRRLLAAAPREDDRPVLTTARFDRVSFQGEAGFDRASFNGDAWFDRASFQGEAGFDRASFNGDAWFHGASFQGEAGFDNASFNGDARFQGASFQGEAGFDRASFNGNARFDGVTFQGEAGFGQVAFQNSTSFSGAYFMSTASFAETMFSSTANFTGSIFYKSAVFTHASFDGEAHFDETRFGPRSQFDHVSFRGFVQFTNAGFDNDPMFVGAVFHNRTLFRNVGFGDRASFDATSFERNARFEHVDFGSGAVFSGATFGDGSLFDKVSLAGDRVGFNGVTFGINAGFVAATFGIKGSFHPNVKTVELRSVAMEGNPTLAIFGEHLIAEDARFPDGVTIEMAGGADVRLRNVKFGSASTIGRLRETPVPVGSRTSDSPSDQPPALTEPAETMQPTRPRLVSLAGTDTANLTLHGIDLGRCQFAGAYNLDQLRIEGVFPFTTQPEGWRRKWGLPVWSWTARRVLAEEHEWRARYERGFRREGWNQWERPAGELAPSKPQPRLRMDTKTKMREREERQERARDLAQTYRALRKGAEDRKDEPGGADFYYGEMEMRRAGTLDSFERALLRAYWLCSGYALRASRSLAALLVVLTLGAVGFAFWGFKPPQEPIFQPVQVEPPPKGMLLYEQKPSTPATGVHQLPVAFRFSAQAVTSLLRGPERGLTPFGEWLHLALRLMGPVLLGLTVLSIRGRVKR